MSLSLRLRAWRLLCPGNWRTPNRPASDLNNTVSGKTVLFISSGTEQGAGSGPAPCLSWHYTQKPDGKEKTRKKTMGFAGSGTGRGDSGVRRVNDYRRSFEAMGRIESGAMTAHLALIP